LKRGTNKENGLKDFFEMASIGDFKTPDLISEQDTGGFNKTNGLRTVGVLKQPLVVIPLCYR